MPEPVRLFAERDGVPPHAVVGLNPGFSGPGCLDAGQEGRIVRWLMAGYRAGGYATAAATAATAAAAAAAATARDAAAVADARDAADAADAAAAAAAAAAQDDDDNEEIEEEGSDAPARQEDDTREVTAWLVLYDEPFADIEKGLDFEVRVHRMSNI